MKDINVGEASTVSGNIILANTIGISTINLWNSPVFIECNEVGKTVEMIYKETSKVVYTTYPVLNPETRVFKIVFSCKKGKWHKSDRIYGQIIPPSDEYYEFNQ